MKILLLAGSYPPETGGIAQYMQSFVEGLRGRGMEVEVIANPLLPPRGYLKRINASRDAVLTRTRTQNFDRVITSSWSPYAVALPAPFEVFCHGMDLLEPSRSVRYRLLMKRTLGRASRVLANSHYTAELAIRSGARSETVTVLYPGVNGHRFQPPKQRDASRRVILSVGRLVERKGFDVVLQAMPRILQQFPDARYVCAGDGPERERLKALASSLKVAERVSWPGEVTEDQKLALYQSAQVFAMPNRIVDKEGSVEGFGIVFLEAAACGIPAVGGNSGGVPDAIVQNVTGFLVNPLSSDEVGNEIIRLLADPVLRLRMGEAARERALNEFREDQIAERYLGR